MNTNWLLTGHHGSAPTEFKREVSGVQCKVSLSPYDVPQGVRGFMDEKNNCFVIEFKYPTDEPLIESRYDDLVCFAMGANSKRLYRIKLDMAQAKARLAANGLPSLEFSIEMTVGHLSTEHPNNRLSDHYNLTKDVILNNRDRLFASFEKVAA